MEKRELLKKITDILAEEYNTPDLGNQNDPLDELIFISLCTRTGQKNVNKAYTNLKARFKSWHDVRNAPIGKIAKSIRIVGQAGIRAEQIQGILGGIYKLQESLNLNFLKNMTDDEVYLWLTSLKNVGPKIAHCVMLFSLGRDVMPVDTHIARILKRLDIAESSKKAEDISLEIQKLIPQNCAYSLHVNLIAHGRKTCRADSPKCDQCCISSLCAYNGHHVLKNF